MTEKQVIRAAMKVRGWSQQKLAEEAGFKYQSNITSLLNTNSKGMRTDTLLKIFNAMGYEIVIRDKLGTNSEWVIDGEENLSIEEQLASGKMTFQEAVAKGWEPSPEQLSKLLR